MRQLPFFSILIITILFAGCRKETGTTETKDGDGPLTGTWELYKSWGGMSPLTHFPEGNGNILEFDRTTFKIMQNGNVTYEGTYQLINDDFIDVNTCTTLPAKNDKPNHIIYNDDPAGIKRYFEVSRKTLRITMSCIAVDGGVSEYRRKSALPSVN